MTASFTLTGHDVTHVAETLIARNAPSEEEFVLSCMRHRAFCDFNTSGESVLLKRPTDRFKRDTAMNHRDGCSHQT